MQTPITPIIDKAKTYYTTAATAPSKDLENYLHPSVTLISPLGQPKGKQAVLEATQSFMSAFETFTLEAAFGSQDQAMLVYEAKLLAPLGKVRGASLTNFQEGLIYKIELFYDSQAVHSTSSLKNK